MSVEISDRAPLNRAIVLDWYRRNRERSRALFDLLIDEAYYSQPIALRHPIVFYEGHLPAFSFNTLVKKALGGASIDPELETLFARGIDPAVSSASNREGVQDHRANWPSRDVVQAFSAEVDRQLLDVLANADIEQPAHALLDKAEAVFAVLEHEAMHQETLLYMWHRLPFEHKRRPAGYQPLVDDRVVRSEWIQVPPGRVILGADREKLRFGWDNEFPFCVSEVAPFAIDRHSVTNDRFLEFVNAGGYSDSRWWGTEDWQWIQSDHIRHPLFWENHDGRWYWRGMFERIPLPSSWPVYVSQAEASAFARWNSARLPSEAEFQRAAFGSPAGIERQYPWGDEEPTAAHGVFDFSSWDPEPAATHPMGRSAWGVEDLVGNGWEWTSTPFAPFPGFQPMASYPEYSADFFDDEHFVMKGASPATARELVRPTFRNWFRARYPYVYAKFRCAI